MRILVLGGTRFVGRHIVNACLARDDTVTLVQRGQTASPFIGLVRHIVSDRQTPTAEVRTVLAEPWDAVIDTSASHIDHVRATTDLIRHAGRYLFMSICGVYSRRGTGQITERSPTAPVRPAHRRYASATRKLSCEFYLAHRLTGVPLVILRLGVVVGPHDYSDRLAYWLRRARRGGDMLVPMHPDQPIQLVDAADVAGLVRAAIDHQLTGVINLPGAHTTANALIKTILDHAGHTATPCWADEEFALLHDLRPWTQMPLWLPANSPERALMNISSARAAEAGLRYTALDDTVATCLAWDTAQRGWPAWWLHPVQEQHLLQQWRAVTHR